MIKKAKEVVDEAVREIHNYQTGQSKPLKSRYQHLNDNSLGGHYPGDVLTIAATSGGGKSYTTQEIEEDFLNKELNPDIDVVLLRLNWEMIVRKLLVRRISRDTGMLPSQILSKKPTKEELVAIKKITDEERRDNIYYLQEPQTPEEFERLVGEFLEEHCSKDKRVVVTIDHMALGKDQGKGKKIAIDAMLAAINKFKLKYHYSVSFIILSQLNREIDNRTAVMELAPRKSDLYSSDEMFFLSDIVIALNNPYKNGHEKYMLVSTDRYSYLSDHFSNATAKKSNFETKDKIFWHYLKLRESDDPTDIQDIHIESLIKEEENEILF